MSHRSFTHRQLLAAAAGAVAVFGAADASAVPISASAVIDYQPGSATTFTNPSAALGLPTGDTTFGALTPFNPPFTNDQIVIAGAGGSITLRLSAPVAPAAGPEIGVFSNNGLIDVSPGGTGTAGSPAATFSPPSAAVVSVSGDGQTYIPLSATPVVFSNPTNSFTDVHIDNYSAPLGTRDADFAKPFTGTLSSFDGLTYEQMLTLLDGSAGGTWLDISSSGLSEIRYVRFDVPAADGSRLVLDAVTAVPEPGAALVALGSCVVLARRRRVRG